MEAELLQNTATELSFRYQEIYEEAFSLSISGGYFATDDPGDFTDSDFICLEFPDKDHAILAKELFLADKTEDHDTQVGMVSGNCLYIAVNQSVLDRALQNVE